LTIIGIMYPVAAVFGPIGAAFVIVFCNIAVLVMQVFKARGVIDLNLSSYVRTYVPGFLMALPIVISAGLLWILGVNSPLIVITAVSFVFVMTMAAGLLILSRPAKKNG